MARLGAHLTGETQPALQTHRIPVRLVLRASALSPPYSGRNRNAGSEMGTRPLIWGQSQTSAVPLVRAGKGEEASSGGLGLMDPNKMARAHVATLGATCRTGIKEAQEDHPSSSFKLIENILEPLKCFISFGWNVTGSVDLWGSGGTTRGFSSVWSARHSWLALERAFRV